MCTPKERERMVLFFNRMDIDNEAAFDHLVGKMGGYPTLEALVKYPPTRKDWARLGFNVYETSKLSTELPPCVGYQSSVRFSS
jgi:hypothetical protein